MGFALNGGLPIAFLGVFLRGSRSSTGSVSLQNIYY